MGRQSLLLVPAVALLLAACTPPAVDIGPDASAVPAAPAVVAGPPCIHQVCGERPRFLQCEAWRVGHQESACSRFEIQYEHHCVCDAWAPAPARETTR